MEAIDNELILKRNWFDSINILESRTHIKTDAFKNITEIDISKASLGGFNTVLLTDVNFDRYRLIPSYVMPFYIRVNSGDFTFNYLYYQSVKKKFILDLFEEIRLIEFDYLHFTLSSANKSTKINYSSIINCSGSVDDNHSSINHIKKLFEGLNQ